MMSINEIARYYAIHAEGVTPDRPPAREAWVLFWPEAHVEIPWPEGLSVREAIYLWASQPPHTPSADEP